MSIPVNKKKKVTLNVDLNLDLAGFGSAREATAAHHKIVKHYSSPWFLGPPVSGDLLELVMHMFTADEADLVQHLPPLWPRTREKVAALSGRPVSDVTATLDHLAFNKLIILASGKKTRRYTILPIVPGTFEMTLMKSDVGTLNAWHRTFAEIFERLFETGYAAQYGNLWRQPVRYLPVAAQSGSLSTAWPAERLEQVLAPHRRFAVGNCQCRVAMQLVGKGCSRPLENCVSFGPMAKAVIERGMMRETDLDEVLEIKRQAEEKGCVTFLGNNNITDWRGNISCSCCGCCCHIMRVMTDFNAPGYVSRPHFLPRRNKIKCTSCMRCAAVCPMSAWRVAGEALILQRPRCIGCGLCAAACNYDAMELIPVPDARPPDGSWRTHVLKMVPGHVAAGLKVALGRLFK